MFLFPAHGSEHIGMSKDLYAHFPCYREVFDYCADYLLDYLDVDLHHLISPPHGQEEQLREKIKETYIVQPALFTVEYSLARFLIDLGVYPSSMLGYSVGEFTAACLADVFSLFQLSGADTQRTINDLRYARCLLLRLSSSNRFSADDLGRSFAFNHFLYS